MMRPLISLVCIAGAIALFFFYTKPTYDGLQVQRTKIAEYDLGLDKAAELQQLKQSLLSRFNAFNPSDIDRLHKLLPDHVDNVRLVLDLDTLASKHGLALQNVVINAPDNKVQVADVGVAIGPSESREGSLTLQFATTGTYPQFMQFMLDLEKSLRIVDVVDMSMDSDASQPSGEPLYRFDLTLRTYWLQ